METKTYHTMDYNEFDELVNKHFPLSKFNFVADEELHNDVSRDMGEITKQDILKWTDNDREEYHKMINGNKHPMFSSYLFLQFFVGTEILPEGHYLINVSW